MKKTGKSKVLRIVIILVCVAVVLAGIVIALSIIKKNNQNKKEALVVSVSSISDDPSYYSSNSSSYSGNVTVSTTQKVYITSTTKIDEVYVTEGQSVKAGDLILKYDVTAQQLQLESKKASVDMANNTVTSLERDLKRLQATTPYEDLPQPTVTEAPVQEVPVDELATDTDAQPEEVVPDTTEEDYSEEEISSDPVYTRAELAEAIQNKQDEIRDAKVAAELEEISYEIMLAQNESSELYCNFDGVVTTINDEDTAINENKPYITISGNEGMTVQAYVGEYSLAKLSIGDSMNLYCYDTGMSYTGTITDIGVVPDESYSSWGAAESYYPVEISVPDATDLTQGMYLEVTTADSSSGNSWDMDDYTYDEDGVEGEVEYATEGDAEDSENSGSSSDSVYTIPLQFVRKEDGKRYVMKDENGKLVKTYVSTGKIYWGYEIEITGGLTQSDYIAFPYLEDSVEGVKTKKSTIDELYGY
jgi:multidrug efflux pump subunit AcrA (membrane-fusion protein)